MDITYRLHVIECSRTFQISCRTDPDPLFHRVIISIKGELLDPAEMKGKKCFADLIAERETIGNVSCDLDQHRDNDIEVVDGDIMLTCSIPVDAAFAIVPSFGSDGLKEVMLVGKPREDGSVRFETVFLSDYSQD